MSPPPTGQSALARRARFASGLLLFAFVASHLINHATGLVSLDAMEAVRRVFGALWRSIPGTVVLAAAALIHLGLAYWAIYHRRQWRMPAAEAWQLLLGLAIPLLVIDHVAGTIVAHHQYGFDPSYRMLAYYFWEARPDRGLLQSILVLVAWSHGCIGISYWLRLKPWFARHASILVAIAVLMPVLALLGFAQAGREATAALREPGQLQALARSIKLLSAAEQKVVFDRADRLKVAVVGLLLLTLLARAWRIRRESRASLRITYPGGRQVQMALGLSVLECSRRERIPHASVCGGRARCSTCRVRVTAGVTQLPAPSAEEASLLKRVRAGPQVRLACQLRPVADLGVIPLIPVGMDAAVALSDGGRMAGQERELVVLFADLRGFTRISESRMPYDVVFLLNRYFEVTGGAIEAAGGVANQFTGDGIMALFGIATGPEDAARQALAAARGMQEALAGLSTELAEELPEPLRLGIGIHSGPAVVGHMGRGVATYLTAVGDTVNTASRLQDATKRFGCQLLVSRALAERAGLDVAGFAHEEITVRNRDTPIAVIVIPEVAALPNLPASNALVAA
ncbi:MAG: adenylate/guanylate cyclase domain-containing protein [Burkholderiales bacterium]